MVEIFRKRGGGDEFINPSDDLSPEILAYITTVAADEPIVAKVSSVSDWFALTKTHLVIERSGEITKVSFGDIRTVEIPQRELVNPQIKAQGGDLHIGFGNGVAIIRVQPGGPYLGLMNVLMRIARLNRREIFKLSDHGSSPTTNDRRPTT